MKKKLALSFITLVGGITTVLSWIWIIVECICNWLFAHKFNWYSVLVFVFCILIVIVSSTIFSKLTVGNSTDPMKSTEKNLAFQKMMEEQNKKLAFDIQNKMEFIAFTNRDEYFSYYVVSMTAKGIKESIAIHIANKICNAMRSRENFRNLSIQVGEIIIGSKSVGGNGFYKESFILNDGTPVEFSFNSE